MLVLQYNYNTTTTHFAALTLLLQKPLCFGLHFTLEAFGKLKASKHTSYPRIPCRL